MAPGIPDSPPDPGLRPPADCPYCLHPAIRHSAVQSRHHKDPPGYFHYTISCHESAACPCFWSVVRKVPPGWESQIEDSLHTCPHCLHPAKSHSVHETGCGHMNGICHEEGCRCGVRIGNLYIWSAWADLYTDEPPDRY